MTGREQRQLFELRGRIHNPDPFVWNAACVELGQLAQHDEEALEELRFLLKRPGGELRLRGMAALTQIAPLRPLETQQFLQDCLLDNTVDQDMVQADAVFAVLWHLPRAFAQPIFEDAVDDARENVRAAAAGSLCHGRVVPGPSLMRLAQDPSPLVRCSLALALPRLRDLDETSVALELLAASEEEYVRRFVANVANTMKAATAPRLDRRRERRAEPEAALNTEWASRRLEELLNRPDNGVRLIVDLEELFSEHPFDVAEILQPLLEHPQLPALLDQVAWLAREPRVGEVCRAIWTFVSPGGADAAACVVQLESALREQRGQRAEWLRDWTQKACEQLAEIEWGISA